MASGITLVVAQAKLQLWLDAEDAIAVAQSYTINTGGTQRVLTRANIAEVHKRIEYWSRICTRLANGRKGPQIKLGVPIDI